MTEVCHDSGCPDVLAIPSSDLRSLLTPEGLGFLQYGEANTAGGHVQTIDIELELRVLTRDASFEILPWHAVECCAIASLDKCLFSASLETMCFVGHQPYYHGL